MTHASNGSSVRAIRAEVTVDDGERSGQRGVSGRDHGANGGRSPRWPVGLPIAMRWTRSSRRPSPGCWRPGGEVTVSLVSDGEASGVMVVARDAGPGIPDIALAMTVGYTTYGGRGLGLPGSQRLMDEFEITS